MICLINDSLSNSGIGNYSFNLFSEFKKMKKPVEMIFLDYFDKMERDDINIIRTPLKLPFLRKTLNWYFYSFRQIPKGHDLYHMTCHYHALFSKHLHPSIITYADILPFVVEKNYPSLVNYFFKKSMEMGKHADKIIAMSNNTKKDIIRVLNIPEEKIEVIYNGIDHSTFKPRNKEECRSRLLLPEDSLIILNVGSEEPRKNISSLLHTFNEICKKRKNVILIRIGEMSKESRELIKNLGIGNKIRYFNSLSKEVLARYYSAADVFVMPSHYEGFGFPALEAMACGCPIVASSTSSLGEIVKDAGLLVDPNNVKNIINQMETMLNEESLRIKYRKMGIERAKIFTWKNCADETWSVYKEILG